MTAGELRLWLARHPVCSRITVSPSTLDSVYERILKDRPMVHVSKDFGVWFKGVEVFESDDVDDDSVRVLE